MTIDAGQMPFRIVIVGGGIAGLATAIVMRGTNRQITILEKSRMNMEVGALLSLQPNAQKILESWNIGAYLEDAQPMIDEAFRVLDTSGRLRMEIPTNGHNYGASRVVYHRQDLHTALRKAATSETLPGQAAMILTASKVTNCDCEAGVVTLADGSTFHGDLIIGADGIHSVIRDAVLANRLEPKVEPRATGVSAYRLLLPTASIPALDVDVKIFDHQRPVTTLMMGYDRRVIMGPARGGQVFGLVCMVPDEHISENSLSNSWTTPGSLSKLLETYKEFPEWIREVFKQAPDIALWQLRDISSLPTWVKGKTILIGDAAHAMLPTQGQGASQSLEDAEALQAFFADVEEAPSENDVAARLNLVFKARHTRASLIQAYSRQQAGYATDEGSTAITLNPGEFMDYNCKYSGAVAWLAAQEEFVS